MILGCIFGAKFIIFDIIIALLFYIPISLGDFCRNETFSWHSIWNYRYVKCNPDIYDQFGFSLKEDIKNLSNVVFRENKHSGGSSFVYIFFIENDSLKHCYLFIKYGYILSDQASVDREIFSPFYFLPVLF